jgi:hypothetical protein
MKAQNNNQKTIINQDGIMVLRSGIVICTVVLISLTVSAQNYWQQFTPIRTNDKVALVMDGQPAETKNADTAIDAIFAEVSTKLNFSSNTLVCDQEREKVLQAESGITDQALNNSNTSTDFTSEEKQESLKAKGWIFFDKSSGSDMLTKETGTDEPMQIESGMTDNHFWGF